MGRSEGRAEQQHQREDRDQGPHVEDEPCEESDGEDRLVEARTSGIDGVGRHRCTNMTNLVNIPERPPHRAGRDVASHP